MNKVSNPFIISGYEGDKYFCDRVYETLRLEEELSNGNNVALIATRRMGKSGLIKHLFSKKSIKDNYYTFFVDIYDTQSLREFVFKLSKCVVDSLKPYGKRIMQRFWNNVKSIQAGINFSPMGEPSFNVQLGEIREGEVTLGEIFKYLEKAGRPCIVAIDEFQQITNYPEKNVEALIRTYVQDSHNVQFVFSGSQRHVMSAMFTSASRPFFQSVSLMHLDSIEKKSYDAFAKRHFKEGKRTLSDGVTEAVYAYSHGVTWYTQKLFNTLYAHTKEGDTCTIQDVEDALEYVINAQEYSYEETLFRLPEKQKMVLIALAKNGPSKGITSASFLKKYSLPSASTVQSAVRGLLEKDYLTIEKGIYYVYDIFLGYWIKKEF